MEATKAAPPRNGGSQPTFRKISIRPSLAIAGILLAVVAAVVTLIQAPDPQPDKRREAKSIWEMLWYPWESHPGLRVPRSPHELNGVSFSNDALRGIAVGAGGTILTTADGGLTWTGQDSGVSNTLHGVHFDASGQHAWAVGTNGVVLASVDGGKGWTAQSVAAGNPLFAVQFLKGGQYGWVVGYRTILFSTNSGKSWDEALALDDASYKQPSQGPKRQVRRQQISNVRQPPIPTMFGSIAAIYVHRDGKRGWAVGEDGAVWKSLDGGREWRRRRGGEGGSCLNAIKFAADAERGWAAGCFGTLLYSRDGGDNWDAIPKLGALAKDSRTFNSIDVSDDGSRIWLAGSDGSVLASFDGGKTWNEQNSGANNQLASIRMFPDQRRGWTVGNAGAILSSKDDGQNWTTQASSNSSTLFGLHLAHSGRLAWAVGGGGTILATIDAGTHWTAQESGTERTLNDIRFIQNDRFGWVVGSVGTVLSTSDGGAHWRTHDVGTQADLIFVQTVGNGDRAWAVGAQGTILRTNDRGNHWEHGQLPSALPLNSVHFEPRGVRGWIASFDRTYRSENEGNSWEETFLGMGVNLFDVRFDETGATGFAVGTGGTILASKDGGKKWERKVSGTNADLNGIYLGKAGRPIWIAGTSGVLLRSEDGESWIRAETKVGAALWNIAFAEDGFLGLAAGYPPGMLRSENGGKNWNSIEWPISNRRYPAPWFAIALVTAFGLLWMSVRTTPTATTEGVEAIAASDAPISDFARDRLQFGPLARGISRFLRNTNTQPPLTIAISGDWGSGKSTLMELVCADLRRYGLRPVWFNAWHHQQEEHFLAALLNAIRSKALPPIGTADGLAFRLRLLIVRSVKHFVVALTTFALGAALVFYLLSHDLSEWTALWASIGQLVKPMGGPNTSATAGPLSWSHAAGLLSQVAAAAAAFTALRKGLKAFKMDPAVLLSKTAENFRLKDASAQTSFRIQFGEQFGEVTEALRSKMVIVIDDLDRCQPNTILTVMEAVNFLVSSGKCFVIFGMATERVQAALGLAFKDLAKELDRSELESVEGKSARLSRVAKREQRLRYARDYIEKLVNLEILVPARVDIPADRLIEAASNQRPNYISVAIEHVLLFWPSWMLALALLCGGLIGTFYTPYGNTQTEVSQLKGAPGDAPSSSVTVAPAANIQTPGQRKAPEQEVSRYVPGMQRDSPGAVDVWLATAAVLSLIGFGGWQMLRHLRSTSQAISDSQSYADALRIWMPVVQQHRKTPRSIKRFGNRLRYLAMLQEEPKLDESGFDFLPRWIQQRLKREKRIAQTDDVSIKQGDAASHSTLPEPLLVTLASLFEVNGTCWRGSWNSFSPGVSNAIALYTEMAGAAWPPSDKQLNSFEHLLMGVKMGEGKRQN